MPTPEKRPAFLMANDQEYATHVAAAKTPLAEPAGEQLIVILKLARGVNWVGADYLRDQIHLIDIPGIGITKCEMWQGKIKLNYQIDFERDEKEVKKQFEEALRRLKITEDLNIVADVIFVIEEHRENNRDAHK